MDRDDILPQLIARRAAGPGAQRPYLVEIGGRTLTYADAHREGRGWQARLAQLGVVAGDPVAVMLPTWAVTATAWIGIARLGAIEVQVNTQLVGRLLSYVLADSGAKVLITAARHVEALAAVLADAPAIETVVVVDDAAAGAALPVAAVPGPDAETLAPEEFAVPQPWDLGTVLYTSGTTGPSKGVMMPWAQLHATATNVAPEGDLGPDDAFYAPYALYHITGKTSLYTMALYGGRVVLRERFRTADFWSDVAEHRCTTTVLMGVMAQFLHREPGPARVETPLRNVIMSPMIPEVEAFKERFDVRVRTMFNMTEVAVPIVTPGWDLHDTESCGRLRPGIHARVVDEHDQEVAHDTVGELIIRADEPWTLNAGYWRNPAKTAEAWRNLWLHTGDAARQDADGNFYFVDRMKDAIRRRGENVSSLELELEVLACPGVLECAAVGLPSEYMEEDIKIVVVAQAGVQITGPELVAFLTDRVPRYMVPRYVELVDALPKTPSEKVRKNVLREAGVTATTWERPSERRLESSTSP
jgi:crotonobetaine/carnitine-CoA ligase